MKQETPSAEGRTVRSSKKRMMIVLFLCLALMSLSAAFLMLYINHKSGNPAIFSAAITGYSMGTQTVLSVYGPNEAECTQIAEKLQKGIDTLESEISWRIEDSQTAQVNREAGNGFTHAPKVAEFLEKAYPVCEDTNGRFDLTIAPITQLWDIDGLNPRVPDQSEIHDALALVGYDRAEVKEASVRLLKGQKLDFGAVGKGAACDRAAEILRGTNATGAVVSVGGSIGVYGTKPEEMDWRIEIQDPFDRDAVIGSLSFEGAAYISTSGSYEKYLEKDGEIYHHLFDATTGYPAESDLVSATVVAESGLLSDALSTACFILGSEQSAALLESYHAAAVLVDSERNLYISSELEQQFDLKLLSDYTVLPLE